VFFYRHDFVALPTLNQALMLLANLTPDAFEFQPLQSEWLASKGLSVYVFRLDSFDSHIGGNKYFKLQHNMELAHAQGYRQVLTFGGAYSNHLRATAAMGKTLGWKTIGVVRGEPTFPLNPVLEFCSRQGMKLYYWTRSEYRNKEKSPLLASIYAQEGKFFIIPEGGTTVEALRGCAQIPTLVAQKLGFAPDFLLAPMGTGGTVAGLLAGADAKTQVVGVSVLKGGNFLYPTVEDLLRGYEEKYATSISARPLEILLNYHFGGYAKTKPPLTDFIQAFEREHQIPLEPVYSGKLFFAFFEQARQDFFPTGSQIVLLHTGGIMA
jgi:1-aminocyclopropane-1-carboxylate deaminase